VILSSLDLRAVLFSPFYNWLRICVVELLLLSLCAEALFPQLVVMPSEDGHNCPKHVKALI
jgi:hypothetical protein